MTELLHVDGGLATLGPELVEVRTLLEGCFLRWAAEIGAARMLFPPLVRVSDLDRFDYFRNFPHLATVASQLNPSRLAEYPTAATVRSVPSAHLVDAEYALPSAACYSIYLYLKDSRLDATRYVTTVAACFRNECEFSGLSRMRGFSMREIVCIGEHAAVIEHLASSKKKVLDFSAALGLDLRIETAADPFFQPSGESEKASGGRALMAKLFPTKEEFVYGTGLAIASLNFHRNFFGERCNITASDQASAFTGCVAFGIERWLHALLTSYKNDTRAIADAIVAASKS